MSVSHKVSPLIKLVARGETTVVDSYLTPVLRRYVNQVASDLSGTRLMFMQSNGGLTDARSIQGKDAILSGPAGGVIGAVRAAERAGFERIIGFDMGGTSTDVSHYNGTFERSFEETNVAGVRLRARMLSVHTVAAGGGSVLAFDGARFRVGPQSAGANPGPACYRRGGPLTVTDCNVVLGRIQARWFPPIFGPHGDQPLDAEFTRAQFADLAKRAASEGGVSYTVEEAAWKDSCLWQCRSHGERDQDYFGATRLRRYRLHPLQFRWRWRAARLPGGGRVGNSAGVYSSVCRCAFGIRHRTCRS